MSILISVVIATHNRSKFLINALHALSNQSLNKSSYEVLVVDNASTDNTAKVVTECINTNNTNVRYIYEAIASANMARNIGWQNALGEFVAYMDDDAIPAFDWLERILAAFCETNPIPGIVGGKVIPIWESERPQWLHNKLLGALSIVDYASEACFLDRKYPFSVNMAFQRKLLEEFKGFDLNLGRKGDKLLSGDETAIAIRIKKAGYQIYYDPQIVVEHFIPSGRLTHSWFAKRYYWAGYSEALMWRILEKPNKWQWFKKLSYYLYGFVRNPAHLTYLNYIPQDSNKFWLKCIIHARIGYLAGLLSNDT